MIFRRYSSFSKSSIHMGIYGNPIWVGCRVHMTLFRGRTFSGPVRDSRLAFPRSLPAGQPASLRFHRKIKKAFPYNSVLNYALLAQNLESLTGRRGVNCHVILHPTNQRAPREYVVASLPITISTKIISYRATRHAIHPKLRQGLLLEKEQKIWKWVYEKTEIGSGLQTRDLILHTVCIPPFVEKPNGSRQPTRDLTLLT